MYCLRAFGFYLRLTVFWIATLQLMRQLASTLATSELLGMTRTHSHAHTLCLIIPSKSALLLPCRWFSIVMYLVFLFMVIVVLLNLLIAQMSSTYCNIQDEAEGTYAVARARMLARLENYDPLFNCGKVCAHCT